ncbi:MAG: hypothetical protein ACHQAX_06075 [Gammaproteobacteria bacterium]
MAIRKKQSVSKWVTGDGTATFTGFPGFTGFLAASINLADTMPGVGVINADGTWKLPTRPELLIKAKGQNTVDKDINLVPSTLKRTVLSTLKWIDVALTQVVSGTLIFGALQHASELAREYFHDYKVNNKSPIAVIPEVIFGALALAARGGLFVAQIVAGALRLPLAIISGIAGAVVGAISTWADNSGASKSKLFWARVGDAVWPFAPTAGYVIATYLEDKKNTDRPAFIRFNRVRVVGIISAIIAITLVALLATGTMGGGLAALPLVPQITGFIATGLNFAFGWAGLHIAAGAAASTLGAPVLSGIASWMGLGGVASKVLVGTMLVGALTTFFSNAFNAVKDNLMEKDGGGSPLLSQRAQRKDDNQTLTGTQYQRDETLTIGGPGVDYNSSLPPAKYSSSTGALVSAGAGGISNGNKNNQNNTGSNTPKLG